MLEMSVAEAAQALLHLFFSTKSDVTNDKSSQRRKTHGVHIKSFKGPTGKFPESQWATNQSSIISLFTVGYNDSLQN